jgi:tetratricopeptide (TPR) repeat protein
MKLLSIVIMTFLLLVSCTEKKEEAVSPDSGEKNIFEEVKEQTIRNPNDVEAWYHLADLYERSELYQEEITSLRKVIAITPKNGNAYIKLGNAYNRLGQYDEAVKNYKTAIKYFPKNPVLYNNLGVTYGKINKVAEEISALKKAISLRPRYATARYNLGVTMLKKDRADLAKNQYHELLKFDEGVAQSLKKEIDAKRK